MKVPPGRDPAATDSAAHAGRYVGPRDLTHWYTPLGRLLAELFRRLGERIGANLALVLTLVVGGGLAALATFAVARIYDAVTEAEGVAGLDQPILRAAMGLRSPTVDTICAGISYVFGPIGMPAIAAIAILVLALRRRSWAPVVLVVAAGLGSLLMTVAGKDIIDRSRPPRSEAIPPYETSPSFPSGHTLNSIVVLGIIAYLLILRRQTLRARVAIVVAAGVATFVVGVSRIILGAHWFTDVLAGWALGAAWLALVITAHRLFLTIRLGRQAVPARPPGTA